MSADPLESALPGPDGTRARPLGPVPPGQSGASSPFRPLPVSAWALAWRQAWRDLRAGELRLLVVAVVLAVAALTAVGFFADRLNAALARDALQLLGGDAVVASDQPPPAAFVAKAQALGLRTSTNTSFPSMARAPDAQGGEVRLAAVKAVSAAYPLRGRLQVRADAKAAVESVAHGPARGEVWVDPALLDTLQLAPGDPLLLGDSQFKITRLIVQEPDRGAGFLGFAPRVMLHADDLPATQLVQPASRITYRLAVAAADARRGAEDPGVREFVRWAQAQVEAGLRGVRIESFDAGQPAMRQTLDRAQRFLNLVALLAALLAAVAVAIAARDFAQRHLDDCAMLRVLGAPQRAIAGAYALEFAAVGLIASALGTALGFAVHFAFVQLLSGLFDTQLPPASPLPALWGLGVGLTLLAAFGLPPVLQLARVPPLRVIRRDVGTPRAVTLGVLAAGLAGFATLLVSASSDLRMGLIAVGGFAAAVAVFALLAWGAVSLLRQVMPGSAAGSQWFTLGERAPRWLVLATRQLSARPAFVVLQVSALSVGLLALMLLVLLRTDLINAWRKATPVDAPNRFVINVQPEQGEPFRAALQAAGITRYDWYPMIRGRLVAINGKAVAPGQYKDERAQRLAEREFNLSHAAQLPAHNLVSAGAWVPDEADGLSVEDGLASTLGLKLGDRLRFDIAGQVAEGRVTSLRKVDWGSMQVNFFVMFPRARMDDVPRSYISAFRAPEGTGFDRQIARQFPNFTLVDLSASIAQVQQVLSQVVRAVEYLFGFTLAAGVVVLFAAVSASREGRAREYAVMRAVGASARLLRQVQRAELLGVGALAGLLAAVAAVLLGGVLARQVFEFAWTPAPWVPLAGLVAGALLAWAAGWWGLRDVLRRPVMDTLRQAAD